MREIRPSSWVLIIVLMMTPPNSADIFHSDRDTTSLFGSEMNRGEYTEVFAVEGGAAHLPCDIHPLLSPEPANSHHIDGGVFGSTESALRLVIWYTGNAGTPVYVYDNRVVSSSDSRGNGSSPASGTHWIDSSVMDRDRVQFEPERTPARLQLSPVRESDQGIYRCRVDFRDKQARNSRVNLTVLVPPGDVHVIYDEEKVLKRSATLTFREGDNISLTCRCLTGSPTPVLLWTSNGSVLSAQQTTTGKRGVESTLRLVGVRRKHLGQQLTCTASNHQLTSSRSITVLLNVLLPPLTARISGWNRPITAGQPHQLSCSTSGSNPPAELSWWMKNQPLAPHRSSFVAGSRNVTISNLTLTPSVEDNGRSIRCRATNTELAQILEDVWLLHVQYPPTLRIKLANSVSQMERIREGENFQLVCIVEADPTVERIYWTHNGKELAWSDDGLSRVFSNNTLTLLRVDRSASGQYRCTGYNSLGTSTSPAVNVVVDHVPECSSKNEEKVWALLGETLSLNCRVNSQPSPTSFTWMRNSTDGGRRLTSCGNTAQTLCRYKVQSDHHFGTIQCWAANVIGSQKQPCLINVVRAELPESPTNCSMRMSGRTGRLLVDCVHERRSPLAVKFVMEVRHALTGSLLDNVTSNKPSFQTDASQKGSNFMLTLYSRNDKGRSDLYITHTKTVSDMAQEVTSTDDSVRIWRSTPILSGLAAVCVCLFSISTCSVLVYIKRKHQHRLPNGRNRDLDDDIGVRAKRINSDVAINPDIVRTSVYGESFSMSGITEGSGKEFGRCAGSFGCGCSSSQSGHCRSDKPLALHTSNTRLPEPSCHARVPRNASLTRSVVTRI